MSILPFKKKETVDNNLVLVEELSKIRRKKKQVSIEEKKLIKQLDELEREDNFIYDNHNLPIARLGISTSTGCDSKLLKEKEPDIYNAYPKVTKKRTWYIL